MRLPGVFALRSTGLRAVLLVAIGPLASGVLGGGEPEDAPPSFRRDVRPLLSENCFLCHGPDPGTREAELRLDRAADALADRGGYAAVVPGQPDQSELWLRVSSPSDPMPPKRHGAALDPGQLDVLERWIAAGAPWEEHWAYVRPERPQPPCVDGVDGVDEALGPIDRFIRARLAAEGLTPAAEASRETLIRRVSLDLTGLPPTLEEVDTFVEDGEPGAYQRVVERLLDSPRFGEALASDWLDAARYGDTHGLHLDNERSIWPYRDWVVNAFNANKPFDQFTIEQLAGDLLPERTDEQWIATGFNRCNPTTAEGGLIDEEYLAKYATDRASTTGTVWLGTTFFCASCHDHKFDPISQREFYRFFAFFNSLDERASDGNALAPPPVLRAPNREQRSQLARLDAAISDVVAERDEPDPTTESALQAWVEEERPRLRDQWRPLRLIAFESEGATELEFLPDGSLRADGPAPDRDVYELLCETDLAQVTALRLEAFSEGDGPGRHPASGNFVLTALSVDAAPATSPGAWRPVAPSAFSADFAQKGFESVRVLDDDPASGWATAPRYEDRVAVMAFEEPIENPGGSLLRVRLHFESDFPQHTMRRVRLSATEEAAFGPASAGPWSVTEVFQADSGEGAYATEFGPELEPEAFDWSPRPDWRDGQLAELEGEHCAVYARRTLNSPDRREIELALGSDDGIRVWLNGELQLDVDLARPYAPDQNRLRLVLEPGENELLVKVVNHGGGYGFEMHRVAEDLGGLPLDVARDLVAAGDVPASARSWYLRHHSEAWRTLDDRRRALVEEKETYASTIPTTLVSRDMDPPRQAYVLRRGQYDLPADPVEPGVPAVFPPLTARDGDRPDRLDLARWLVSPQNPLTARVTVNRLWQRFFGRGLVDTPEDFGSQGSWPTHPQLLDWLAVEFIESGWDMKAMVRLLVTSATYRQKSHVNASLRARDPENRLYARAPRLRLSAEVLRDSALAISGLLVERLGGAPVRPYQPDGVWKAVAYTASNTAAYIPDQGDALYRRSLYTFWKRTAPPPTMQLFDAPMREACSVRRARTNTPLQALALMNDVQFVEAARVFAERILREEGDDEQRLTRAFRSVTARWPSDGELDVLRELLEAQRTEVLTDEAAAAKLASTGEAARDESLDVHEVAAWMLITTTLLNLDEVVSKG